MWNAGHDKTIFQIYIAIYQQMPREALLLNNYVKPYSADKT